MKKQALTVIEIEGPGPSNVIALDERRRPVSKDGGPNPPKPEPRRRAALHRLIESFALASCSMAGVCIGVWLDPPDDAAADSLRTVDREKEHRE
jgi:hypothetical protein